MSCLVLDDKLLGEYIKFKYNQNPNIFLVTKMFNYYKTHITNLSQMQRVYEDLTINISKRLMKQLGQKANKSYSLENLAKESTLKLILTDNESNYPYIDINNDKFQVNFTATYIENEPRVKIVEHIKDLVQNGDKIKIYDKYLFHDNQRNNSDIATHSSVEFINQIINSNLNINYELIFKATGNNNQTTRIKQRQFSVDNQDFINFNTSSSFDEHDRYIRILNNNILIYEIVLSSGVFNILNNSKDMTYLARSV